MPPTTSPPLPPPKSPPHASPPPPHEPPTRTPPTPPAGMTASETHGAGFEIKGSTLHHAPVYRVGSSQPGGKQTTTGNRADVLELVREYLATHEQGIAATPGTPPPPSTLSITATAEPPGATAGLNDQPHAALPFRIPHGGPVPPSPHLPPYKGAHGSE